MARTRTIQEDASLRAIVRHDQGSAEAWPSWTRGLRTLSTHGHPASLTRLPERHARPGELTDLPLEAEDDRALARMIGLAVLGGVGAWAGLGAWLL